MPSMRTVNLATLTKEGEIRNLTGHERGQEARHSFGIDDVDRRDESVTILVPDYIYTISPSFFQGMFGESVRKAGNRDKFLSKFKFVAPPIVNRQILSGINSSLIRRDSIFAR